MTRPRTVLYLIDKLHRAGAQTNLGQLARGLDRARFEVVVVCLQRGGALADELEDAGVEVRILGLDRIYGGRAFRALGRFAREIRLREVRILHCYLRSANVFGAVASSLAGVPTLLTTRRDLGFSRNWKLDLVEQWFVNPRASRVVTPADAVSEKARQERGLSPDKVVTIPNGVDTDVFRPEPGLRERARAELGLPAAVPVAGVIANFLAVKGHADFLGAAARLRAGDARFVLVGDGPLAGELRGLTRSLGLEGRVLFAGVRSDTRELLSLFDVLVSPSHSEGMSNVLLEAMAMARPIVATAVGGNPEVVRHGETGLLVPPRSPEALAAAMETVLRGGEAVSRMARRARDDAVGRFAVGTMVHRYMDLYEELLEPASARSRISS